MRERDGYAMRCQRQDGERSAGRDNELEVLDWRANKATNSRLLHEEKNINLNDSETNPAVLLVKP